MECMHVILMVVYLISNHAGMKVWSDPFERKEDSDKKS